MDYTTVARVKTEMQTDKNTHDTLIGYLVTAASRAIDRECTGAPDSDDYFKTENVLDEISAGQIDNKGVITVYPHKYKVNTLTAFSYRLSPVDAWVSVDVSRSWCDHYRVEIYPESPLSVSTRCICKYSYNGGLADSVSNLPADFVEAATILAIRYYKEAETGLNDAIGIAELGTLTYTKDMPIRVAKMLNPYRRIVGWRSIA